MTYDIQINDLTKISLTYDQILQLSRTLDKKMEEVAKKGEAYPTRLLADAAYKDKWEKLRLWLVASAEQMECLSVSLLENGETDESVLRARIAATFRNVLTQMAGTPSSLSAPKESEK